MALKAQNDLFTVTRDDKIAAKRLGIGEMSSFPMAIKKIVFPWQLTHFQSPPLDFNVLVIFSLKNVKQGHKLELKYLYP